MNVCVCNCICFCTPDAFSIAMRAEVTDLFAKRMHLYPQSAILCYPAAAYSHAKRPICSIRITWMQDIDACKGDLGPTSRLFQLRPALTLADRSSRRRWGHQVRLACRCHLGAPNDCW